MPSFPRLPAAVPFCVEAARGFVRRALRQAEKRFPHFVVSPTFLLAPNAYSPCGRVHERPRLAEPQNEGERHTQSRTQDPPRRPASQHLAKPGRERQLVLRQARRIVANRQADRVQIFFDDKPPEETRAALTGEGWNWSRSEGEWQRKLTDAAKASAKRIVGLG